VADGLESTIAEYEKAVEGIDRDTSKKVLETKARQLQEVEDKLARYRDLLGGASARLEDDLARVRCLLQKRAELIDASELPPAPTSDNFVNVVC
jgi:hypothetical protein